MNNLLKLYIKENSYDKIKENYEVKYFSLRKVPDIDGAIQKQTQNQIVSDECHSVRKLLFSCHYTADFVLWRFGQRQRTVVGDICLSD